MQEDYLRQDGEIRREADHLLDERGLRALLLEYGTVHVFGSYALQLMAWRDLDINLETRDLSLSEFFALGRRIAQLLRPVRMSFIDNRPGRLHDVPCGLYWGIRVGSLQEPWEGGWKIDIWAMEPEECAKNIQSLEDIRRRLTPEARETILRIKSQFWRHPEYRKSFSGPAIYEAVLDHGVTSTREFANYLREHGLLQTP